MSDMDPPRTGRFLAALGAVATLAGGGMACDQNVKFTIFKAKLDTVRPGMAAYSQPVAGGGPCLLDADYVDVGMLPLYTRRDPDKGSTVKELLEPDNDLASCQLKLINGLPDEGRACNVGTDDVDFRLTRIELQSRGGLRQCCGAGCVEEDGVEVVDDCAAAFGEGWACEQSRNACDREFELNAVDLTFDPVGDLLGDRIVALVIDNSGTLEGNLDGVPKPHLGTDRTPDGRQNFRISAAVDLAGALHPNADEVVIYTYDTAGVTGVTKRSQAGACAAATAETEGFVRAGNPCVAATIQGLGNSVAVGKGSPIWDAVVRAANDLRARQTATGGGNPSLVVFADGPPDSTDDTLADAIAAATNGTETRDDDIPVFVAHLDNTVVHRSNPELLGPPTLRYADYEALACATGGAYFYVDNAEHLVDVYTNHLPFLTRGKYILKVGYTQLKLGAEFPSDACYAVKTQVALTVEGEERTLALQKTSSLTGGGAKFDSRIHVCKE